MSFHLIYDKQLYAYDIIDKVIQYLTLLYNI